MAGSEEKEAVLNVFAGLVRPLMRVAFEYGISASEIAGVVRRSYIQALEARLQEQRRPTTDARLAVVAGIPKSDVVSLRIAVRSGAPHSMKVGTRPDQIASLLTAWHTHSNFSGAYGLAMDLDLIPIEGSPQRSFQELIDFACPGIDRETLLDELVAARSVEVIDGATVRCLSRAYVPPGADVTRIERTGRFLSLVAENFVHNLLRAESEPGYFERAVVSEDPMSIVSRDLFLKVAAEKGQELLGELDTFLASVAMTEKVPVGKKYGVGIYFFEDELSNSSGKSVSQDLDRERSNRTVAAEEIDVLAMPFGKK